MPSDPRKAAAVVLCPTCKLPMKLIDARASSLKRHLLDATYVCEKCNARFITTVNEE
jgi:transcriptional regulator NrdR family protein